MSKGWAGGSSRAQRQQRGAVLLRDGGLCQLKLDNCDVYATQVHHRHGINVSGKVVTNLDDLEAACATCNRQVGDPTHTDPDPDPRTKW
jgi:5-methylcytosine-specific restriction endonuclease McrA